jgi:hypothetical protein
VNQVGALSNYGTVWYESAIANIFSLLQVKKRFPTTYDIKNGNQFVVVKPGNHIVFKKSKIRLYYHNTMHRSFIMVNTDKDVMVDMIKSN